MQVWVNKFSSFILKTSLFRGKLGLDFWQGKQTFGDIEVESTTIAEKSASW